MGVRQNFSGPHVWDSGRTPGRMLKKASLPTRPTLAATAPARPESAKTASSPRDAPCPKQGRGELPLFKRVAGMIPTAGSFRTRPPTGTPSAISPSEGLLRPRVARARGSSRPPRPLFQHPARSLSDIAFVTRRRRRGQMRGRRPGKTGGVFAGIH